METLIRDCTRCEGPNRKVMGIVQVPAGHSSWLPSLEQPPLEPAPIEWVCGRCLTDDEIERSLTGVMRFVLGVYLRKPMYSKSNHHFRHALEMVHSLFVTCGPRDSGRSQAVRALGLDDSEFQ